MTCTGHQAVSVCRFECVPRRSAIDLVPDARNGRERTRCVTGRRPSSRGRQSSGVWWRHGPHSLRSMWSRDLRPLFAPSPTHRNWQGENWSRPRRPCPIQASASAPDRQSGGLTRIDMESGSWCPAIRGSRRRQEVPTSMSAGARQQGEYQKRSFLVLRRWGPRSGRNRVPERMNRIKVPEPERLTLSGTACG